MEQDYDISATILPWQHNKYAAVCREIRDGIFCFNFYFIPPVFPERRFQLCDIFILISHAHPQSFINELKLWN